MSLIDQLAKLRELQGKEPLPDPRFIEGFGPGAPAPPAFETASVTERDNFEEPEMPVSPLVAAARPKDTMTVATRASEDSPWDPVKAAPLQLAVFDSNAAYLGRSVTLNDRERNAVTSIVLRALQRVVSEQLEELRKLGPRRKRKLLDKGAGASVADSAGGDASGTAPEPVKKRRGRPRGSLLKRLP